MWESIPQTHQRVWESAPKKNLNKKKTKTQEGLGVDVPKPSGFGGLVIKKNSGQDDSYRPQRVLLTAKSFSQPLKVYNLNGQEKTSRLLSITLNDQEGFSWPLRL
jgi:hypothetical protein